MPIRPAVRRSGLEPPDRRSSESASTGRTTFTTWFHTPVTTTATATDDRSNPHPRSIAYDAAIPTASPPGTATESAVDVCVSTMDWR